MKRRSRGQASGAPSRKNDSIEYIPGRDAFRALAYVNQGYTGRDAKAAAEGWGIRPGTLWVAVVKLPEARKGFVLLPGRWVVERSFAWLTRFRRLARDYEHLPETVTGLHLVTFSTLMLARVMKLLLNASA